MQQRRKLQVELKGAFVVKCLPNEIVYFPLQNKSCGFNSFRF